MGTGGSFAQFYNLAKASHTAVTDRSYHTHPVHLLDEEMETRSC